MNSSIQAVNVGFNFPHESPVFRDLSLTCDSEVVAVTGASGSGKSTLLLCLAGILTPQHGRITISGQVMHPRDSESRSRIRREHVGLVFQFSELVAELTILENVMLPLELLGASRRRAAAEATSLAEELGIGELVNRHPSEVSGGQAQRAAVARALVHRPAVVLADEPTGALDATNAAVVLQLLITAARQRGSAVVLVTHDPTVAKAADRTFDLSRQS